MAEQIVPIPEPPGLPFIGFTDIDREFPLGTLVRLADQYGTWDSKGELEMNFNIISFSNSGLSSINKYPNENYRTDLSNDNCWQE
jgi:hypothetical protein